MPLGTTGGGVLRGHYLPEEDGSQRLDASDGQRGGGVPASLGRVRLPLEARRGRRLGIAYTVCAKLVVLFCSDALKFTVAGLTPILSRRPGGVPLVC